MSYNHPKLNQLSGGWYAVFSDGSVITEDEVSSWSLVQNKKNITLMGLKRHNKFYEIPGKKFYGPPGETHYREIVVNPGTGFAVTKQSLIGWTLCYYDGKEKVILRVSALDRSVVTERVPLDQEII